jgi:hypothetical protein
MEETELKSFLIFALNHFEIDVFKSEGKLIDLEKGYRVEIESNGLFKLLQSGEVIAPFDDVDELCKFIKMDMLLNEKG